DVLRRAAGPRHRTSDVHGQMAVGPWSDARRGTLAAGWRAASGHLGETSPWTRGAHTNSRSTHDSPFIAAARAGPGMHRTGRWGGLRRETPTGVGRAAASQAE